MGKKISQITSEESTISDTDWFEGEETGGTSFKTLFSAIKSTLKTYFDSVETTLTNKTLTAPTIADFTNAAHDHGDADDGGVVVPAAIALTTQGDIPYHNGTALARLGAGTAGFGLQTLGASANPKWSSFFQGDGAMVNGKLSVTVASNNLTVALKTYAGTDPSATDPVYVLINGTVRAVTAALSVTLNAGTQWFALGIPFATLEQNFFAYLGYRTASTAVVIGFARIPYARLYSDFSATTTNELHGAFSTAPAATDDVVNIGRFAATLSATPSYNWSVPTFTSANLIQKPTYETEWMYWLPAPTGYSAVPTNTIYIYKIRGKDVITRIREQTNGTSNATTLTMTAPFTAQTISNGFWMSPMSVLDNGSFLQYQGYMSIATGSATMTANKDGTGNWTNVNGKRIPYCELWYPIAA